MSGDSSLSASERVYEVLLLMYPRGFRESYGPHMVQAFGDLRREELARAGAGGLAALWLRTLVDLLSSALAERGKVGVPLLSSPRLTRFTGLAAMVGGALSAVLVLRLFSSLYQGPFGSPRMLFSEALDLLGVMGSLLLAAGMLGLYACVARVSPKLATLGVVLALFSAAALAGTRLYESLVVVSSGYPKDAITPFWVIQVAGTAKLVGFLLLGVALLKARALGRWSALPLAIWLLPSAAPLLFLPFSVGSGGELVGPEVLLNALFVLPPFLGYLGWVLMGYLLWSGRSGEREGAALAA